MDKTVTERINYWIEFWETLIADFLKKSYGLNLYNPRVLIDDIITEIEENGFKNQDNKKYFYSKLSNYILIDDVVKMKVSSSFKLLRKMFNGPRLNYILETAKGIKTQFDKGLYFNYSLELLSKELLSDEPVTIQFINSMSYLSQGLIIEFLKRGYSLKEIKDFPSNVFDVYTISEVGKEKIIHTSYPHKINYKKYLKVDETLNYDKYNEAIVEALGKLTNEDRIKTLSEYFFKKLDKAHYIFVVEGIKGDKELKFGGVCFYSLSKKRFVTRFRGDSDIEDLQLHVKSEYKYIQAAVEVPYLLTKSSLTYAIAKVEAAIDLLCCYFETSTEIHVDTTSYIVVKNGSVVSSSWGTSKKALVRKHSDAFDLVERGKYFNRLDSKSYLWDTNNDSNRGVSKLRNALHWFRKGEHSIKDEDKMLNYWIALENLFNLEKDLRSDILEDANKGKFHLIQEIIASVQIFQFIYDYGWELHSHYRDRFTIVFGARNHNFPESLIKKAQFKPKVGEKIYLKNFVTCLPKIEQYETNLFILEKIKVIKGFYSDSQKTKKIIEDQIQQIKEDVLLIYRFRNLIVHNAHYDNTLLPYLVWKIREYSGHVIRSMISDFRESKSLSDSVLRLFFKREEFLSRLESGKVDLFNRK